MKTSLLTSLSSAVALTVTCVGLALSGCDAFEAATDCNTICTRYKDCYDGSYDVAACASRCRTRANTDTATGASVNRCEACINDRACISATFNCTADCSDVVP